jgi:glycosyltransferase involved in cell wall biosynthesis
VTDPLVSVIIPCYRQGHWLPQAIDCALGQTHPRVEVVVVNDGSDDDTEAVARRYGGRVGYVSQPNGGLSSARNAGMRAAAGRYFFFLDADDLLHPRALEWLTAAVGGAEDRIGVMGYRYFTAPGRWWGGRLPPRARSLLPWLVYRNFPVHCFLVPAALARATGEFATDLRACEDHHFWLRAGLRSPRASTVRRYGAYYRRGPESMSADLWRMRQADAAVLVWLARAVLDDPANRAVVGPTLLGRLHKARVWRLAQPPTPRLRQELDELAGWIAALRRRGARFRSPLREAVCRFVPGRWRDLPDRAFLAALRAFCPPAYRAIRGPAPGERPGG